MSAPDDVRDLAAAIRAALDVPIAFTATGLGALYDEQRLRERRTRIVRGALTSLADGAISATVAGAAEAIREMTAETPVTYPTYTRTEQTR